MTIKRRLFFSNIRVIVISFAAVALLSRFTMYLLFRTGKPDPEAVVKFLDVYKHDMVIIWIFVLALFIILISVINNFYTHRMTKKIIQPLEILSKGVEQIYNKNLSFRIDYQNEDEFRPVCDAFNEMASNLEISARRRHKDEENRKELIAGISHDLRTPLTAIKGCIEGFEAGIASTAKTREKYLAIIKNKTESIERVIEQLFLFSKLDMDEFAINSRRANIGDAVSDMIDDCVYEYASRGLVIKLEETPKNIFVNIDAVMLRRVIINIFENSLKYKTRERCEIEVRAEPENDFIVLRLTDDGPGAREDALPKLFDVFYRADPSRVKAGSGLGLAISEKIIKRMGGEISAELPANGGLAIIIKLPILHGETP